MSDCFTDEQADSQADFPARMAPAALEQRGQVLENSCLITPVVCLAGDRIHLSPREICVIFGHGENGESYGEGKQAVCSER